MYPLTPEKRLLRCLFVHARGLHVLADYLPGKNLQQAGLAHRHGARLYITPKGRHYLRPMGRGPRGRQPDHSGASQVMPTPVVAMTGNRKPVECGAEVAAV